MEVHVKPELEARLKEAARETGRSSDELVEDALIGYFDELAQTRQTLDRRFDDLESGRVAMIDGEEAFERLMKSTEGQRRSRPA